MDIRPFALPNTPANEVRFEDPRDIQRIVVSYAGETPESITTSYLRKTWPQSRPEIVDPAEHSHGTGWMGIDDWFNSTWQEAKAMIERVGDSTLSITFEPVSAELPDVDCDVRYRRTLGVEIESADGRMPESVEVYTTSKCAMSQIRAKIDGAAAVKASAYNAVVDGIEVGQDDLHLTVRHLIPSHAFSYDEGLLTFELADDAFTISIDALAKQGPIWFAERGAFITFADDPTTLDEYKVQNARGKSISQRITERKEQSLSGAMNGQPRAHPCACTVGCKNARQRFWLEPSGDILTMRSNLHWIKGRDTDRCKIDGDGRFMYGLYDWQNAGRYFDPAPVMVYNTRLIRGDVMLEQKTFAMPLEKPISDDLAGDDTIICLSRFRFTNTGSETAVAELPISYSADSGRSHNRLEARDTQNDDLVPDALREKLVVRDLGGMRGVYGDWHGQSVLRCAVESEMEASERDGAVVLRKELAPGETCEVLLKIPYIDLDQPGEMQSLAELDYDKCYHDVTRFWREECSKGAQIHTGEPVLDALYRSHVAHVALTDSRMPDDPRLINTSVGTSTYGNYTNESCMIVEELDERGLHDEARRRIEVWLKYQGTVGLTGMFTDHDGVFYGAGGYEMGQSYDQHHGWVLWVIARHFELNGDADWLRSVADKLVKGVDWVARQRTPSALRQAQDAGTGNELPHSRCWERGFLAPGGLEDVTDFFYWLSTNALTWRGVEHAARALEAIDHPDAARVRAEADDYRQALVRGFETMRRQSPLVRLKNGRWVPHHPSRLYRRGRDIGWIREVLEGSVYLLISGLFEPDCEQAEWILKDYLDNRYLSSYYGYPTFQPDWNWVDYGGFSNQPNLLAGLLPHLDRDEPEIYIWMFMNAWAACYREEVNAMVEHPQPVMGFSNAAIYKTSDQANAIKWLRYMFVYATPESPATLRQAQDAGSSGGLLHLGRAIPREWFRDGNKPCAKGVATRFGDVSVSYQSEVASGRIIALIEATAHRVVPGRTLVRFRHPYKLPIRSVTVNGKEYDRFDPEKGDVDITRFSGRTEVVVSYGADSY